MGECFLKDPAHLQGNPHTLHQGHKINPLHNCVPDHAPQCTKVNVPNLAAYLNWAHVFDWCVVRFDRTQRRRVLNRDWATGSKFVNHSRINREWWAVNQDSGTFDFENCSNNGGYYIIP